MPRAETIIDNCRGLGYYGTIMSTAAEITTADQLLREPSLGRCELVRGELVLMSPSGSLHAIIAAKMAGLLWDFVEPRKLGWVFGAEGGFQIGPRSQHGPAPDVAFVSAARMPATIPAGFFPGPPDLAVEVLSPHDRASEVLAKVSDWLETGCPLVWVVDPENRSVTVYGRQEGDAHFTPFRRAQRRGCPAGLAGRASEDFSGMTAGQRPEESQRLLRHSERGENLASVAIHARFFTALRMTVVRPLQRLRFYGIAHRSSRPRHSEESCLGRNSRQILRCAQNDGRLAAPDG